MQNTEQNTKSTESGNFPEGKRFTNEIAMSKEIATRVTTTRLQRLVHPMNEFEVIQVEEYLQRGTVLREGVKESMSIIDSSASVLHSQMHSLLKVEDEEVRKPGEWATQLAVQCGKGIAELIKAKTDAMRLLK